jgi:hypothetical protein
MKILLLVEKASRYSYLANTNYKYVFTIISCYWIYKNKRAYWTYYLFEAWIGGRWVTHSLNDFVLIVTDWGTKGLLST